MKFLLILLPAVALAASGGVAIGDPSGNSNVRTIQVNGNGEAHAAPDYASLNLAIETHAKTAAEAASRNAALAQ
ncbi:MAG TPA: SIMPL domain-containing protein, partial [Candidatus Binataceae bacterium]|nr:SIMPL domain-containing protein [Candidatus Binataceae bacterium]